ncbi:hypothetical protein K1T71_006348 [Dendrolimus kikuchii]|uniref:Uncharacterized protein n=1 Tax=Dendrolimus kikuchii TaxID=765133 RepID=A0ACC1D3X7_9NEOP|nr:hypothetical protein K1T71_006348 [Dendrolimus kikuchii]
MSPPGRVRAFFVALFVRLQFLISDVKPSSSCSVESLEHFLDSFVSSVHAIQNLNLDELADFMFLHTALRKLDSETVPFLRNGPKRE